MATDAILYLTYTEAVFIHLDHMRKVGETRCGVFERALIESALARPQHAAVFEGADILRQAASLYFGLIKNHPWVGGNKRTASLLVDEFLFRNKIEVVTSLKDVIALVHYIEADVWHVDEIEVWLRAHTIPLN